jgi:preprotein translocase subunit SecE
MAKNDSNSPSKGAKSSSSPSALSGNGNQSDSTNNPASNLKSASAEDEANKKSGLGNFFKEVQIELSKVAWPSRQQLISESIAVLLMVIVAALLVYLVDSLFGWAATQVFQ